MAKTIVDAIRQVLMDRQEAMTATEIYESIVAGGLYQFNADDPAHVVRSQIRRHCKGLDFASASPTRYFVVQADGRYALLSVPEKIEPEQRREKSSELLGLRPSASNLRKLHQAYEQDIRRRVLHQLTQLEPSAFERFSRRLLEAYGFENMKVSRVRTARDGGIDGHGHLKLGVAQMNVAFQCKKWEGAVGRPEIDRFRGAIQGAYEQGIFFTTSRFTPEAKAASFKSGAVPVVLIDGSAIVDLMIERSLGIEVTHLPVYSYAVDLLIDDAP